MQCIRTEEVLKKKERKNKSKLKFVRIMKKLLVQHLIHDDNHHYNSLLIRGGGGIIENLQ